MIPADFGSIRLFADPPGRRSAASTSEMKRRLVFGSVAVLVVGGLALAAYFPWRARERRAFVAASVPPRPDLRALPAELSRRVAACEQRARAGADPIAGLAELSRLYHANGFLAEAGACYQALMQVDPADAHWPYRLATIVAGYGQLDEALPLWQRAVALAPDYLPARLRLADTLLKKDDDVAAAKVYAAVVKREPRNPYALLGLARVDLSAGRWDAARERLEIVVQQSNYGIGYDLLPTVYEHLGMNAAAEAIRARQKASGAFFDVPDPWIDELIFDCYDTYRISAVAGTADHGGDLRLAMRVLARALALEPDRAVYYFQMGGFCLKAGDLTKAREHFERCTVLAPDFADGWAQLTDLEMKLGNRAAAERSLSSGLQHCPASPGLHLERGRRLAAAGLYPEAIREFQLTVQLRPQEADGYIELAQIYFGLERIDEGVAELKKSLQVEPGNPVALTTLAFFAINIGDEAAAREKMRLIRLQPRIAAETTAKLAEAFRQKFGHLPE